jgi:hypothetical protein
MNVAGMVVRASGRVTCREISGEWIDPGTRTDTGLAAIQTGAVCIGAAGAEMAAAYAIASKTTAV